MFCSFLLFIAVFVGAHVQLCGQMSSNSLTSTPWNRRNSIEGACGRSLPCKFILSLLREASLVAFNSLSGESLKPFCSGWLLNDGRSMFAGASCIYWFILRMENLFWTKNYALLWLTFCAACQMWILHQNRLEWKLNQSGKSPVWKCWSYCRAIPLSIEWTNARG